MTMPAVNGLVDSVVPGGDKLILISEQDFKDTIQAIEKVNDIWDVKYRDTFLFSDAFLDETIGKSVDRFERLLETLTNDNYEVLAWYLYERPLQTTAMFTYVKSDDQEYEAYIPDVNVLWDFLVYMDTEDEQDG